MLKQDVPLRTGWFGYRKLDVENCIAHIRAAYAADVVIASASSAVLGKILVLISP